MAINDIDLRGLDGYQIDRVKKVYNQGFEDGYNKCINEINTLLKANCNNCDRYNGAYDCSSASCKCYRYDKIEKLILKKE